MALALQKLVDREADVFDDLTEQDWGDVPALMDRHGCDSSIGMLKLFVRSALAEFGKTEAFQHGDDFSRFENGNGAHRQPMVTVWVPTN